MSTVESRRLNHPQLDGHLARLRLFVGCLGLLLASGAGGARSAAAQTQCPFEIIRGCRCPADCNSDRCEKTCVVVGRGRGGSCVYQCSSQCLCEGIACKTAPWWQTLLSGLTTDANAAVPEGTKEPLSKVREINNDDGNFVIVPKEEIERLTGESAGIGLSIVKTSSGPAVVGRVVKDGPAGKAGLEAGDEIASIDGRKTDGLPITTISQWLRGRSATLVVLKVKGKDGKTKKISLNRVELSTIGAADKPKPDVSIRNLTLKELKSTSCPAESDGCNLLTQDGEDCTYSCKNKR